MAAPMEVPSNSSAVHFKIGCLYFAPVCRFGEFRFRIVVAHFGLLYASPGKSQASGAVAAHLLLCLQEVSSVKKQSPRNNGKSFVFMLCHW
jgi:hypothetical protein